MRSYGQVCLPTHWLILLLALTVWQYVAVRDVCIIWGKPSASQPGNEASCNYELVDSLIKYDEVTIRPEDANLS